MLSSLSLFSRISCITWCHLLLRLSISSPAPSISLLVLFPSSSFVTSMKLPSSSALPPFPSSSRFLFPSFASSLLYFGLFLVGVHLFFDSPSCPRIMAGKSPENGWVGWRAKGSAEMRPGKPNRHEYRQSSARWSQSGRISRWSSPPLESRYRLTGCESTGVTRHELGSQPDVSGILVGRVLRRLFILF